MALTGNGAASKEQVAGMLQRMLKFKDTDIPTFMDATDALAAAYCHFIQMGTPVSPDKHYGSWKDFALRNKSRTSLRLDSSDEGKKKPSSPSKSEKK